MEKQKRRAEEKRSEKRKSQKKEDAGARKGRKLAKHCVFPMICGSGGSKSRLAKGKTEGLEHFWTFRCRFACQAQGLYTLSKVSKM